MISDFIPFSTADRKNFRLQSANGSALGNLILRCGRKHAKVIIEMELKWICAGIFRFSRKNASTAALGEFLDRFEHVSPLSAITVESVPRSAAASFPCLQVHARCGSRHVSLINAISPIAEVGYRLPRLKTRTIRATCLCTLPVCRRKCSSN